MAQEARQVVDDLEALAVDADGGAKHQARVERRYTRARDVLWILAGVLAGIAGVLAVGDAPKWITALAAFLSATSTAFEARFTPNERRIRHKRAAADYRKVAWKARQASKRELSLQDRTRELDRLYDEKHRLDRGDGLHGTA